MRQPVTDLPLGAPLSRRRAIVAWIAANPYPAFALFAALHGLVWTLLPSLLYPNLPLDLIEALTYGREWQLGYDKLPPLPWWLVEIARQIVGHDFAYYALAQIAVLIAFWLVFAAALPVAGPAGAFASILIADGLHYFGYTAAKFNHDVIQLPFWALAGFSLQRALRGGGLVYWALLGAAIGSALWAKYFVVVLAMPVALFLLLDPRARRSLLTPGPWIAGASALALMAPHFLWLMRNDFLPFAYAAARAAPSRGAIDHLLHPGAFALGQVFFLLPALLIALPLFWPRNKDAKTAAADFDFRIVTLLAFGPAVTVIALSALSGRGTIAMWGYPLWLFLGSWIVLVAGRSRTERSLGRILAHWGAVFAVMAIVFVANYEVLPRFDHRYRAAFFPGKALGQEISRRYRAAAQQPLVYVVGSMWEGGNIGHYAPERPRVLIDGRPERAPWIDLADLRSKGAVFVWTEGDLRALPVPYRRIGDHVLVQEPFAVPFRRGERMLNVGWAILPPQPHFAGAR